MVDRPQLSQVNLVVASTEASAEFYRLLGLDVPAEADIHMEIPQPARPVSLELDAAESAVLWNASWRRPGGGGRVILGVALASTVEVDERYEALTAAGHAGVQPPFDAFWGARYAIVADPDGNHVGLMGPVDEARRDRTWPPEPSPDP